MAVGIYIVRAEGHVGYTNVDPDEGGWLCHYDPDAYEGGGSVVVTRDPAVAIRFAGPSEALNMWQSQSSTMPIRPEDGKPNRPLTAFTIELRELPDDV